MASSLFGTRAPQAGPAPMTNPMGGIPANGQPAQQPTFQPPANFGQIKGLMNMFQNGMNPQSMMQAMISQNPQYNEVMNLVNQHGGDPKAAFYALAKQKGVDPNQVLSMLRS